MAVKCEKEKEKLQRAFNRPSKNYIRVTERKTN
jgi:hypothetical protein